MRLWDLRTAMCQGLLQAPAQPCATFDQQASQLVLAPQILRFEQMLLLVS